MQKIWFIAPALLLAGAPGTIADESVSNQNAEQCLAFHARLERLRCYDALHGYVMAPARRKSETKRVVTFENLDAEIRATLASDLRLGDAVAVQMINRDPNAVALTDPGDLAALSGTGPDFEALRDRADLHMALRTTADSPELGVLAMNCRRDITEFWLRWEHAFNEELSRVWVYSTDNIAVSEARPEPVFSEPGQQITGFSRGLPSIALLKWLAVQPGDRFAIEAGSKSAILIFERARLIEMISAQRRYCSWR